MGQTELTPHPIRTVLSLDCHQVPEVVPNCSGRVVRSAGGEYRGFGERACRGSLSTTKMYWNSVPIPRIPYYRYIRYRCTSIAILHQNECLCKWSAGAHSRQLIHFSSLPCTTIHQSKALGLSITTVYGTSSAELIQHQFPAALFTVK